VCFVRSFLVVRKECFGTVLDSSWLPCVLLLLFLLGVLFPSVFGGLPCLLFRCTVFSSPSSFSPRSLLVVPSSPFLPCRNRCFLLGVRYSFLTLRRMLSASSFLVSSLPLLFDLWKCGDVRLLESLCVFLLLFPSLRCLLGLYGAS
jgi:hypothetical protein